MYETTTTTNPFMHKSNFIKTKHKRPLSACLDENEKKKTLVARYFLMALHFQNPYKYISFPMDIIVC